MKHQTPLLHPRRAPLLASLATLLLFALPVHAESPSTAGRSAATAPASAPSGVVNLNSASEAELQRLPGIGASKARAIVALRTKMKRFERVEDIMRVKGIGRKTFRDLQPMLTLQGATTLAGSAPKPRKKK